MGRIRRALRCRRGISALEFGLAGAPALLLLLAGLETGWQLAAAAALDYGAQRASRFASTGANSPAGAAGAPVCRSSSIPWVVSQATGGFLRQDRLRMGTTSYSNYANAAASQGGIAGAGTGGQTVSYTLTYRQPYLFVHLATGAPYREYSVTILAKNEPFTDAAC